MKNKAQQKSELDCRINRARLAGAMHGYTIAEFTDYLLDLGLTKYEKSILPLEQGVALDHEANFQNTLDDFLREMGYIE